MVAEGFERDLIVGCRLTMTLLHNGIFRTSEGLS